MYLLEVFSFIYNFLVCSEVWFLSSILVPRTRTWLLKLWKSWALCPNEPVYSWLVFVIHPSIAPGMVPATCPFSTQRWRLCPTGAAAVVPAVLMCGLLTAGLLSTLVATVRAPWIISDWSCSCSHVWVRLLPALPRPVLLGSWISHLLLMLY